MYIDQLRRNIVQCCEQHNIEGMTVFFLMRMRYDYRTLLIAWRTLQNGHERSFARILNLKYPLPKKEFAQRIKPVDRTMDFLAS